MSETDTEIQGGLTEIEQAPQPEPKPVEVPKSTDETGLRDTIQKAVREQSAKEAEKQRAAQPALDQPTGERPRGPDGKFLPKDADPVDKPVEQPKIDVKPSEGAQPGAEQPKPKADAAPGTWKAEAKAEWEKLPPSAKGEILRRESDFSREIGKYQQQIQQINQAYTPLEQVIGPRRALWRAQYGSEGEALKRLTNLSDLASQSPNDFLAFYLSQPDVVGKVDLQKVFGQQAPGDDITRHPVVAKLNETISGLQQQVNGFLQQHQTQQHSSVESQIAAFAKATGTDGTPLRPHFETVREDVFNMIPVLRTQFPQDTVEQSLQRAYDIAVRTNEGVAGEIRKMEEQRLRESIEKEARAKKAHIANKSVPPGAPPNGQGTQSDASDLRAELLRNMKAFNSGNQPRI